MGTVSEKHRMLEEAVEPLGSIRESFGKSTATVQHDPQDKGSSNIKEASSLKSTFESDFARVSRI